VPNVSQYLSILIFLGATGIGSVAAAAQTAIPWGVDANTFASFSACKTSPLSAGKTIIVSTPMNINSLTVPADRSVKMVDSGKFNISADRMLTIKGPFAAELKPVFSGSGQISFAPGSVKEVYPQWWGGYADGTHPMETTRAIQAAVNSFHDVFLPAGAYHIDKPITLRQGTKIRGSGKNTATRISSTGSGIFVTNRNSPGSSIEITGLALTMWPRHTDTANSYTAIDIGGKPGNGINWLIMRDLFIDGFQTGINMAYVWESVFENINTIRGSIGFRATGYSVSNVIDKCKFQSDGRAGSRGIVFAAGDSTIIQGWNITNTSILINEIGIEGVNANFIYLTNNYMDFNGVNGIFASSSSGVSASGWSINNNYIAMSGTKGSAAIHIEQNSDSKYVWGNNIRGNTIETYADRNPAASCNYGIRLSGSFNRNNIISENIIGNFKLKDIIDQSGTGATIIANNICKSDIAENISGKGTVVNNIGRLTVPAIAPQNR